MAKSKTVAQPEWDADRRPGEEVIETEFFGKPVRIDPLVLLKNITEDNVVSILQEFDRNRAWVQVVADHATQTVDVLEDEIKRLRAAKELAYKSSGSIPAHELDGDLLTSTELVAVGEAEKLTETMVKNAVLCHKKINDMVSRLYVWKATASRLCAVSATMGKRQSTLERLSWSFSGKTVGP